MSSLSRMGSNAQHRYRRFVGITVLVAACGGDGAMGPAAGVTGVWRGRAPLGSPVDSLLLILVDSTNGVSATAAWTLGDETRREMFGAGQLTGASLAVTLDGPTPSLGVELDLELAGSTLTGTMTYPTESRQGAITLRRVLPASSALVGVWVLTAVRGITITPGPEYADTLTLGADGRARRALGRKSCRSAMGGAHDSRGGWLYLEFLTSPYLTEGQCGYSDVRDSLRVRGSTLTRYTPLVGGGMLEEDFARR